MTRPTITLILCTLACATTARADPPTEGTTPVLWPTPAPIVVPSTYQGHTAQWWAQRSRRAHRHVHRLQSALRERLPVDPTPAFLCIHRYEGSWTDPAAPFWGGLQMDMGFQRKYGKPLLDRLGTADRWPPYAQLAVAMVAYASGRGFYPWPNTARACGLL